MSRELHNQCQSSQKISVACIFQKTKQVFDISPATLCVAAKFFHTPRSFFTFIGALRPFMVNYSARLRLVYIAARNGRLNRYSSPGRRIRASPWPPAASAPCWIGWVAESLFSSQRTSSLLRERHARRPMVQDIGDALAHGSQACAVDIAEDDDEDPLFDPPDDQVVELCYSAPVGTDRHRL